MGRFEDALLVFIEKNVFPVLTKRKNNFFMIGGVFIPKRHRGFV